MLRNKQKTEYDTPIKIFLKELNMNKQKMMDVKMTIV